MARSDDPKMESRLSELASQLRAHRLRAERLKLENERLERNLRIATELRGVSVNDIQIALYEACKEEAEEEHVRRIKLLEVQLAEKTFAKDGRSSDSVDTEALKQRLAREELRRAVLEEERDAARALHQSTLMQIAELEGPRSQNGTDKSCELLRAQLQAAQSEVISLRAQVSAGDLQTELEMGRVSDLEGQLKSLYFAHEEFVSNDVAELEDKMRSMAQEERQGREQSDLVLAKQLSKRNALTGPTTDLTMPETDVKSESSTVLESILTVKSIDGRGFGGRGRRKLFVVLESGKLSFFSPPEKGRGGKPMHAGPHLVDRNCTIIEGVGSGAVTRSSHPYAFGLFVGLRQFVIAAETRAERARWLEALYLAQRE